MSEASRKDAMEDPEFPSGPWTGYFLSEGSRHEQDLELSFHDGVLGGHGDDGIGPFSVQGRYNRESMEVWWNKTYLGKHTVYYKGYREPKGIWGVWEIGDEAKDGFHIWPKGDGGAEALKVLAEEMPMLVGETKPGAEDEED